MELISLQNCCVFLLYFLIISVLCDSTKTQESVDNVGNEEIHKPDFHERKAIPLHKSDPLPDQTTTRATTSSKLTTLATTTGGSTVSTDFITSTANFTTSSISTTSDSSPNTSLPTTAPTFHPITAPPSNGTCQSLLEWYAGLSSNFTNCAIIHAKPFLFCENCVKQYVETLDAYEVITDDEDSCKDTLLLSDRVQIVNQIHRFVKSLWDDGNCDYCFEDVNKCLANQTCSLSLNTRNFMASYKVTMACFKKYRVHKKNESDVLDVCTNCSYEYMKLTEYYEATGPLDNTCMDIVELMNHTRITWSREFHCINFKRDIGTVVALGCFIGVLPLFFYCAVRVHAEKQERRFIRQKRLSYASPQSNIQYRSASTS